MKLSGEQRRAMHGALLAAFPSISDLEMLVSFAMDTRLEDVASAQGSLAHVVFELLVWAEARGHLELLLTEAAKSNPGNPALRSLMSSLSLSNTPVQDRAAAQSPVERPHAEPSVKLGSRTPEPAADQAQPGLSTGKRSYRFGTSTLSLEFGDITSSAAQALVSSDDYYLSMAGGVSRAILRAGGQSIALEAAKAAPAELGDVVVTTAGQLPARHVFHSVTIGPSGGVAVRDVLKRIIPRCFQLVDALGVRSIAFPAIGAGTAGFPLNDVAAIMAELIVTELEQRSQHLDVTIYLLERGQSDPLSYVAFFEQFAVRLPRVATHEVSKPVVNEQPEASAPRMVATTAEQVRSQRIHQIYTLITQVHERRYTLEQLLIVASLSPSEAEKTAIEQQLTQNEQLKRRFLGELAELTRGTGGAAPATGRVQTVFVSSTYSDLKDHRSAVKDQITKRGLLFKGMEHFGADPAKTPATLIVQEVADADAFIGIVGARYGSIDGASGLSMTELEFNAARAAGKPMLLYVMDDNAAVPFKDIEQSAEGKTKLDALRDRIMREHVVAKFTTIEDLAGKLFADLGKLVG